MMFDAGTRCAGGRGTNGWRRLLGAARACAVATVAAGAGAGYAQGYPEKPVRLIVPFPPGGNIDIAARTIAPGLSEALGGSFVVDYRPGASGTIGVDHVAKSAPDGHTLLIGSTGTISSPPAVYAKLPFDTLRDLAPIAQVNDTPLVIVVHPSLRARTVRELVGLAKEKPGRMTMGTPGSGTPNYLAGVLLQQQAGIALTHVPYKGSGPGIIEAMGGHVDIFVDQLTSSMSYIRSGRLRALAVTTGSRSSYLPDVPTLAEAGVKGYEASTFAGLLAPAGTPRTIVDRINAAVVKVVATGAVRERFATVGAEAKSGTPEQFRELIRTDLAKWVRVVREAGIKLEL